MSVDRKWMRTMQVYDAYEKRFAKARLDKPFRVPLDEADRHAIIADVKRMLAFDEALVPSIGPMEEVARTTEDTFDILQLRYTTWENFYAAATLYMPHGEQKVPLVFLFSGHNVNSRLSAGLVTLAARLAKNGVAVMVQDNIGQGDRKAYGHRFAIAPFYCGLTLQGMILMESVALIRRMLRHPRVDKTRVGAAGNSGGGTLCLFLAALAPEITALCSAGYPSEFSYILSKERRHCCCNLLPGCAHGPDMWEVLSTFAPKPLMMEMGEFDALIPADLFRRSARKVRHVYRQLGAEQNFSDVITATTHPWAAEDRAAVSGFFEKAFGLPSTTGEDAFMQEQLSSWSVLLPDDGLSTEALAEKLTGKTMPAHTRLWDVYPPTFGGQPLSEESVIPDIGRGEVMRVFAQMECALKEW